MRVAIDHWYYQTVSYSATGYRLSRNKQSDCLSLIRLNNRVGLIPQLSPNMRILIISQLRTMFVSRFRLLAQYSAVILAFQRINVTQDFKGITTLGP